MAGKTLAQKMQPVLRRPGMYVGQSPIKLLWYLSGMFDLEGVFSMPPGFSGDSLILSLADMFAENELENGGDYVSAVEIVLLQGDPDEKMRLICKVAGELLLKLENSQLH
jgi:hypothetical protein